jgi:hypothetical protein
MRKNLAKFAFVLFWFNAYYRPYYQPYSTYFHPSSGPCYGVGCPAGSEGKQFHYNTGKS